MPRRTRGADPRTEQRPRRARPEIEQHDARVGQLRERRHQQSGLHLAAELGEIRDEGVGDRLRSAACDGPPVDVTGDAEDQTEPRRERMVERDAGMGRETGEERVTPSRWESLPDDGGGQRPGHAEPGHRERMASREQRCERTVADVTPPRDDRLDEAPPTFTVVAERSRRVIERSRQARRRFRRRGDARGRCRERPT